jgi:hypothetical protein
MGYTSSSRGGILMKKHGLLQAETYPSDILRDAYLAAARIAARYKGTPKEKESEALATEMKARALHTFVPKAKSESDKKD